MTWQLPSDLVTGAQRNRRTSLREGGRCKASPKRQPQQWNRRPPMPKHPLSGSEREIVSGARSIGKADPTERLEVTVLLRRRGNELLKSRIRKLTAGDRSEGYLKRDEYARQFGADPGDIATVRNFASNHGL